MEKSVPHNFIIALDFDGKDVWVGTGKGLGWAVGDGYYPGVKANPDWLRGAQSPAASLPGNKK